MGSSFARSSAISVKTRFEEDLDISAPFCMSAAI